MYLLGASPIIHESYEKEDLNKINKINCDIYGDKEAISYRNSKLGYKNSTNLYADYDSVRGYIESLDSFVYNNYISNYKEFYSQIRLKAKDNSNIKESLLKDGINYLEIRSIDINPLERVGISLNDLKFVHLFTLFLLNEEENSYKLWQEEALKNQLDISIFRFRRYKSFKEWRKYF